MQKGKKYVASDGYEYFMCPFTEFKVTQGENTGTHLGTRAVDFASGTAGYRAPYYAPATVVCVMTVPSRGQAMWRSVNKVHCPNGYFGIVTFVTVHDDSFDAYVGLQVPQGNQLGNMGTKGNATGVHCHLELIQASMSSANWYRNGYGVWTYNGKKSYVDDTFYVDDTNIIYGGYGNWRKTGSSSSGYKESDLIAETGVATMTVDSVQARLNSPTGSVVRKYNTGDKITYSWKWVGNGHRYIVWQEGSNKIFLAVSNSEKHGVEPWATFAPIEEEKPSSSYDESQLTSEHAIATFTRDDIIVRKNAPDGEDTGKRFMANQKQEYTEKWVGNGHRYISWVENGVRYFASVSGSETRGEDSWATFTSIPETGLDPDSPSDTEPSLPESVVLHGIDVSEHNSSDIDFTQFDYVILRANWWTTTDKKFKEFADKLDELGIPYGVYCYDYCGDEESALEQAKYTYELIKDRDIKMGVWMDMEDADGWKNKNGYLNKEHCSMVCKVFCDFFKEKGYYTGVYSTKWWFENYCPTDYPKWVANWGTNDGTCQSDFSDYAVMHQYTSYGGLDKNVAYHEVYFFKSNPIKEEPTEPSEPDDPTDEPITPPEEEKPSDTPNEPDKNTIAQAIANFFKAVVEAVANFIKSIFK